MAGDCCMSWWCLIAGHMWVLWVAGLLIVKLPDVTRSHGHSQWLLILAAAVLPRWWYLPSVDVGAASRDHMQTCSPWSTMWFGKIFDFHWQAVLSIFAICHKSNHPSVKALLTSLPNSGRRQLRNAPTPIIFSIIILIVGSWSVNALMDVFCKKRALASAFSKYLQDSPTWLTCLRWPDDDGVSA